MLKGLGLLLIVSCGGLTGWGKARTLRERAEELGRWRELLRQLSMGLETTRAAPGEILRMTAKQTTFTADAAVQRMAEAFRESGSFAHAAAAALAGRRQGTAEQLLLELGDTVGVKPLPDQLSALRRAELLMAQEEAEAREVSRKQGGLWQRLGLLLGLMAAVVLA